MNDPQDIVSPFLGSNAGSKLPPEIQTQIFDHIVHDRTTLTSAVRVNRLWHDRFVDILWERLGHGGAKALASAVIKSEVHRQHYANQVRVLHITNVLHFGGLQRLRFPNLEEAYLSHDRHVYRLHPRFCLRSYLQPLLKKLRIEGDWMIDDDTLDTIQTLCPKLETLGLTTSLDVLSPSSFLDIIQSMSSLQSISLGGQTLDQVAIWYNEEDEEGERNIPGRNNSVRLDDKRAKFACFRKKVKEVHSTFKGADRMTGQYNFTPIQDMFKFVASCDEIEKIRYSGQVPSWGVRETTRVTSTLFPKCFKTLRDLDLSGGSKAMVPIMLAASDSLTSLSAIVDEADEEDETEDTAICQTISQLSRLSNLSLRFSHNRELDQVDLDQISLLSKLRKLSLRGAVVPWMASKYLSDWVSHFPALHELNLGWGNCRFTASVVKALGVSCPRLETCVLAFHHNIDTWYQLPPGLFPGLASLKLGSVAGFDDTESPDEVTGFVKMLLKLAPKLERFHVDSNTSSSKALSARWKSYNQRSYAS